MEEIKAYIASGILELYVLGDISAEERLQVEAMASKHPEVRAELDAIELSLEKYAIANTVEPAEELRDRVLNSMLVNLADDRTFSDTKKHTAEDAIVIPARRGGFYKYAFAACLALLIVSVVLLVNMYDDLQESKTQIISLQLQKAQFTNRVNLMDHQLDVYRDSSFKFIRLKGTPKAPASALTVAWSPVKRKVMIDMAGLNLPQNDKEHQYQLWAIVDGKPVDLGVFDATAATDSADMKEMKPVAAPQAFAVTLEKRGGSANPTLEEMVVISNI